MDTTTPLTFAARLTAARERVGLSQAAAAARAGVSTRSWWAWEAGKSSPDVDALPDLALVLGCEPTDLVPPVGTVRARQ